MRPVPRGVLLPAGDGRLRGVPLPARPVLPGAVDGGRGEAMPSVGINHWSGPAWDIFKPLYLAQIELDFHYS